MKNIFKLIFWVLLIGILIFLVFGRNKNKANAPDVDSTISFRDYAEGFA